LHHTGIKISKTLRPSDSPSSFQLHHTGIKIRRIGEDADGAAAFQLHHTGIKRIMQLIGTGNIRYFNCTIQELKDSDFHE